MRELLHFQWLWLSVGPDMPSAMPFAGSWSIIEEQSRQLRGTARQPRQHLPPLKQAQARKRCYPKREPLAHLFMQFLQAPCDDSSTR